MQLQLSMVNHVCNAIAISDTELQFMTSICHSECREMIYSRQCDPYFGVAFVGGNVYKYIHEAT